MVEQRKAHPRQGNTKRALALNAALEADEEAKQAQRETDARASAETAEKALAAKQRRRAERHAAERKSKTPGRKVR